MNTQIQISTFNFKSKPVRIQSFNNEPYFCLSDVCEVLGVNRRSAEAFRLNEKGCNKIATLTNGGHQEITFINEPNLYRIIFRSNKAEAVEFQNWVFEEVLPQIRKTGSYSQNVEEIRPLVEQPELLSLLIRSYHFLHQAHEFRNKAVQTTMGAAISQQLGGHYLYNFDMPLQQHLTEIKAFIHSSNERLMFVEGMLDLLSKPQLQQQPKTQTFNFLRHR